MSSFEFCSSQKACNYFDLADYTAWHGVLASTYYLEGNIEKEKFDKIFLFEDSPNRNIGVCFTFSAPKSVSLAFAYDDETKEALRISHLNAVKKTLFELEFKYISVFDDIEEKLTLTHNILCAELVHYISHPVDGSSFKQNLDLHSHCVIHNGTVFNKRLTKIDWSCIFDKDLFLDYRSKLAGELQAAGFQISVTDKSHGIFELDGFDYDVLHKYSN